MAEVTKSVIAAGVVTNPDDRITVPHNAQELPLGYLEISYVLRIGSLDDSRIAKIRLKPSALMTDDQQIDKWGNGIDAGTNAMVYSAKVTKIINENAYDVPTLTQNDKYVALGEFLVIKNDSTQEVKKVGIPYCGDPARLANLAEFFKDNVDDLYFGSDVVAVKYLNTRPAPMR